MPDIGFRGEKSEFKKANHRYDALKGKSGLTKLAVDKRK
jgi:hypothetical protein